MSAPRKPRGAPKAPHPADERRAAVLAAPAGFTASIRFNGRNSTLRASTLPQAAVSAYQLEQGVAALAGGTQAIVYALAADGGGHETVSRSDWLPLVSAAMRDTIKTQIKRNLKG